MTDHAFYTILNLIADGKNLPQDMSVRAFQIIMNGGATPAQMGAFLMGLRIKGETAEEITGGAMAMRAKAKAIKAPPGAIDTCGTGGSRVRAVAYSIFPLPSPSYWRRAACRWSKHAFSEAAFGIVAIRLGGCAFHARRQGRCRDSHIATLPRRMRHLLFDGTQIPSCHAPCCAGAAGAWGAYCF